MVKFDNSYSWTRSKEVYYSIKLLPPSEKPLPPATPTPTFNTTEEDEFFDCEETELADPVVQILDTTSRDTVATVNSTEEFWV